MKIRRLFQVLPWVILGVIASSSVAFGMAPSEALAGLTATFAGITNIAIEGFKSILGGYEQYLASS